MNEEGLVHWGAVAPETNCSIYRRQQVDLFVFFFLKVAKVNNYIYHDSSDRSLLFHKVFYKIGTPFNNVISLKTLLKNIRSVITVVIFSYACVLRSSSLVCVGPRKFSLV